MFYYIPLYLYIQRTTSLISIYNNHKLEENGSADSVSDDNYIQHYYTSEKPSCLVRAAAAGCSEGEGSRAALCPHMQRVRAEQGHGAMVCSSG